MVGLLYQHEFDTVQVRGSMSRIVYAAIVRWMDGWFHILWPPVFSL